MSIEFILLGETIWKKVIFKERLQWYYVFLKTIWLFVCTLAILFFWLLFDCSLVFTAVYRDDSVFPMPTTNDF